MPRFILLEHTGAPDDPAGRHFDLLLEAGEACRTWRLPEIPSPGGPPVTAVELAPHRLTWLDHEAGEVSGGRGFARRVERGDFRVSASDLPDIMQATHLSLVISGSDSPQVLQLVRSGDHWAVRRHVDTRHSPRAQ
ncbi:MAG: hypothetical protein ACKOC8_11985 [Pirellulales bacterium]